MPGSIITRAARHFVLASATLLASSGNALFVVAFRARRADIAASTCICHCQFEYAYSVSREGEQGLFGVSVSAVLRLPISSDQAFLEVVTLTAIVIVLADVFADSITFRHAASWREKHALATAGFYEEIV